MAEAELQTFTSIMDALVRISVSMTLILSPDFHFMCAYLTRDHDLLSHFLATHLRAQVACVLKACEAIPLFGGASIESKRGFGEALALWVEI